MAAPAPIESLTGIRYLAAAAVLMYHFVPADHSLGWLFRDGWLGVPFFFTLSGAVLAYSYLPTFLDGEGISWRRFLALRLVRIYPCYLLAFINALVPFVHLDDRCVFVMGIEAGWRSRSELMLHIVTPLDGERRVETTSLAALRRYDPQAAGLLKMEAAIALRDADLPTAARLLQQHLARSPTDAGSWLTLSEVQMKLGDFDAAEQSRQKASAVENQ
jgi:hypothetical protein